MASSASSPSTAGHRHDLGPWQHDHVFDAGNRSGETRTRAVLALTVVTMVVEVIAGWWTGSMALLADGWHMGTHALALGVAAIAYAMARRRARDPRYAWGTWKIEVLASFGSAMVLGLVALSIIAESAMRLWRAEPIVLHTALIVAVVGLVVNLASAWLLHGADVMPGGHHHHGHGHGQGRHAHDDDPDHTPGHAHDHEHFHHHGDHDLNLRAAYVHVVSDALTSVLAIAALCGALWFGWWWLDPLVGVGGAVVIAVWAVGLMRESAAVLLDREMDHPLVARVRAALESDGDAKVADLHVWRVGRERFAAIAALVADHPRDPGEYRERLRDEHQLAHVSIEVNRCRGGA